jgi:hypothetical protein
MHSGNSLEDAYEVHDFYLPFTLEDGKNSENRFRTTSTNVLCTSPIPTVGITDFAKMDVVNS